MNASLKGEIQARKGGVEEEARLSLAGRHGTFGFRAPRSSRHLGCNDGRPRSRWCGEQRVAVQVTLTPLDPGPPPVSSKTCLWLSPPDYFDWWILRESEAALAGQKDDALNALSRLDPVIRVQPR